MAKARVECCEAASHHKPGIALPRIRVVAPEAPRPNWSHPHNSTGCPFSAQLAGAVVLNNF